MKALTLLDYVIWILENKDPNTNPVYIIYHYTELLRQRFEPDLIVDLFKEWEVKEERTDCTLYNHRPTNNTLLLNSAKMYFYRGSDLSWQREGELPQTLEHFISDCTRAGISLEFKEAVSEKYFK